MDIEQSTAYIQNRIKLQQYALRVATVTNKPVDKIHQLLEGSWTLFELEVAFYALSFGEFDETKIVDKATYAKVHLLPEGKNIYRRQISTAKSLYERIVSL